MKVSTSEKVSSVQDEALGVASGYAPGQIKICIFPQATPKAFYCTIFDLRTYPQTTPRVLPLVLSKILKFARLLQYSSQRRGTPHTYLYLYAVALQSTYLDGLLPSQLPLPLPAYLISV
ncbi:hypothetical protein T06_11954 [Trichinella sp. T6]|nr:hypothetical protein T06_11954 [Trichinella sp. T6]